MAVPGRVISAFCKSRIPGIERCSGVIGDIEHGLGVRSDGRFTTLACICYHPGKCSGRTGLVNPATACFAGIVCTVGLLAVSVQVEASRSSLADNPNFYLMV